MNVNKFNPDTLVSVLVIAQRQHIFDLSNIVSEKVLGAEASLRLASEMLGKCVTLKPIVDAEFESVQSAAYARFWHENTPNFQPGKKKTKDDWNHWKHLQPEYVDAVAAKGYIDDLIKKLSMNYIPRLRDLTDSTRSAERTTRLGEGAQHSLPRFPASPPAPMGGSAPGVR